MRFFGNLLLNIKNECGILISRLCRNEEKIMPEVVLRPAEEEDIAEMLALYAPYVVQTTVSSEYDAPSMEEFTRRWRTYTQSCRGWSAALTARLSAMAMLRRTVPALPISGRSKRPSTLHRSSTATASPVRFTPRCLNCWRCRDTIISTSASLHRMSGR